jgi:hypothetical protein
MKTVLFLLALFPLCSNAFVEWPFKINDFQILIFNISIGTPSKVLILYLNNRILGQTVRVGTFHLGFPHPLIVPDKQTDGGNMDFDSTY